MVQCRAGQRSRAKSVLPAWLADLWEARTEASTATSEATLEAAVVVDEAHSGLEVVVVVVQVGGRMATRRELPY